MAKVTIADILEKKKVIKPLELTYNSEFLGGEIEIKKIAPDKIIDLAKDIEGNRYQSFCKMIYACCPLFHSKELHEEFKPVEPFEIVDKVFQSNILEITEIGTQILKIYGLMPRGEVEQIKKL